MAQEPQELEYLQTSGACCRVASRELFMHFESVAFSSSPCGMLHEKTHAGEEGPATASISYSTTVSRS